MIENNNGVFFFCKADLSIHAFYINLMYFVYTCLKKTMRKALTSSCQNSLESSF